jgi:type VI secretion system protein ImpG
MSHTDDDDRAQPDRLLASLLPLYEEELSFLRRRGKAFARQQPHLAARLGFRDDVCDDPHIERLLESFAFIAARTRKRIEDDFPEFTQTLLECLYPNFLRPTPSLGIACFDLDPKAGLTTGQSIDRGAHLLTTQRIDGQVCEFRTVYPVDLWPVVVKDVTCEPATESAMSGLGAATTAVLRVRFALMDGVAPQTLPLKRMRLHVAGESRYRLHELLCSAVTTVRWHVAGIGQRVVERDPACIVPVGFEPDESLVPMDARVSLGHQTLLDYFALPEKFLFVDVTGVPPLDESTRSFELVVGLRAEGTQEAIRRLAASVSASSLLTGCTPVVNVFERHVDGLRIGGQQFEYAIHPDRRTEGRWLEPYAIKSVVGIREEARSDVHKAREYLPLFSLRAGRDARDQVYWTASRRPDLASEQGATTLFLRLVDRELTPTSLAKETLSIDMWCTNRDLPSYIRADMNGRGDLKLAEGGVYISAIRFVAGPTHNAAAPNDGRQLWQMITALNLNHTSLDAAPALRQVLRLYNTGESESAQSMIDGIVAVESEPCSVRVGPPHRSAFVRGTRLSVQLNEDAFQGRGTYLFSTVLHRFLALRAAANTHVEFAVSDSRTQRVMRQFEARAGARALV